MFFGRRKHRWIPWRSDSIYAKLFRMFSRADGKLPKLPDLYGIKAKLYAIEALPKVYNLSGDRILELPNKYHPALVFALPRKKAITMFSILSGIVAERTVGSPPASPKDILNYFRVRRVSVKDLEHYIRYRLCLYKLVAPIRHILRLPQRTDPYKHYVTLDPHIENILRNLSSPGLIMREIYYYSKKHSIRRGFAFTYSLVHTFDRVGKYLRAGDEGSVRRTLLTFISKYYGF